MSRTSIGLTDDLQAYLVSRSDPLDEVERSLREETENLADAPVEMLSSVEQGRMLAALVRMVRARLVVEVGTFTGWAALCMARALPEGGRLVCLDVSEEWTAIGRKHWERAGVAGRVDLRIGPALQPLRSLPADNPVDLAFIDADKAGYVDYYEALVPLLSPHGAIVADNVLAGGRVVDPEADDATAVAIRRFNDHVTADPRTSQAMLPVSDGITLITLRP